MAESALKCYVSAILFLLFISQVQSNRYLNDSCPLPFETACLPVGEAFNLFHNYGFLALSIQVAPLILFPAHLNGTGNSGVRLNATSGLPSLFHMVTHPILDRKLYRAEIKRIQVNNPRSILI